MKRVKRQQATHGERVFVKHFQQKTISRIYEELPQIWEKTAPFSKLTEDLNN